MHMREKWRIFEGKKAPPKRHNKIKRKSITVTWASHGVSWTKRSLLDFLWTSLSLADLLRLSTCATLLYFWVHTSSPHYLRRITCTELCLLLRYLSSFWSSFFFFFLQLIATDVLWKSAPHTPHPSDDKEEGKTPGLPSQSLFSPLPLGSQTKTFPSEF